MNRKKLSTAFFAMVALAACSLGGPTQIANAQVCDWMTAASYYTHDQTTMQRVNQYSPDPKVFHTPDPSVSSYRHQRSSLVVDGSIDQYHKVYRSGGNVRPYGEWQYPYRPYSVPFSDWAYGSPFGHLANPPRTNPILPPTLLIPGYSGYPGFGFGNGPGPLGPGNNFPGNNFPGNQVPGNQVPGGGFPGGGFPGGGVPFPSIQPGM